MTFRSSLRIVVVQNTPSISFRRDTRYQQPQHRAFPWGPGVSVRGPVGLSVSLADIPPRTVAGVFSAGSRAFSHWKALWRAGGTERNQEVEETNEPTSYEDDINVVANMLEESNEYATNTILTITPQKHLDPF